MERRPSFWRRAAVGVLVPEQHPYEIIPPASLADQKAPCRCDRRGSLILGIKSALLLVLRPTLGLSYSGGGHHPTSVRTTQLPEPGPYSKFRYIGKDNRDFRFEWTEETGYMDLGLLRDTQVIVHEGASGQQQHLQQ